MQLLQMKGKNLQVVVLLSAAAGATALTFILVWLLTPAHSYIHDLFFERSKIQYVTTYIFWVTIVTLVLNHRSLKREQQAHEHAKAILAEPKFGKALIWSDAESVRGEFTDEKYEPYQSSVTFSRVVNGVDRLRKMQSTKALEDYFRTRSEIDASALETSYAGVRYFVWLLPTLGLIGTVMGMGIAISGFGGVIQNAQNFQEVKGALPAIMKDLGTAFDTTFLGVGLSAVALFYMSFLLKLQEQLLEEIDNLCLDGVCALFQEHTKASDELVNALQETARGLRETMNGNRAEIARVLREELPSLLADALALQEGLRGLRDGINGNINGNRAEMARVAREELPTRLVGELAPRLDGLGDLVSGHLERIGNSAAQAGSAHAETTERLTTALREIKLAQQEVGDHVSEALRSLGALLQRNNELLCTVCGELQQGREATTGSFRGRHDPANDGERKEPAT